jgi:hypothetical protein
LFICCCLFVVVGGDLLFVVVLDLTLVLFDLHSSDLLIVLRYLYLGCCCYCNFHPRGRYGGCYTVFPIVVRLFVMLLIYDFPLPDVVVDLRLLRYRCCCCGAGFSMLTLPPPLTCPHACPSARPPLRTPIGVVIC